MDQITSHHLDEFDENLAVNPESPSLRFIVDVEVYEGSVRPFTVTCKNSKGRSRMHFSTCARGTISKFYF